jgi:PAS domain S-box-containing protein
MAALPDPGPLPAPPPEPPALHARGWRAYGIAVLLLALALALRAALAGVLGGAFPYITVYPVLGLLLWRGMTGPAAVAALLAVCAVEIAGQAAVPALGVAPDAWQAGAVVRLGTFGISAAVLFGLGAVLRRLRDQSNQLARRHQALAGEAAAAAARFDAIVQHASDAILSCDSAGLIRSWNPAAERLFGYPADEIIGRPVSTLAPPERPAEPQLWLQRVLQGELVVTDAVRRTRDGRALTVRVALAPMRAADGSVYGATAIVHDVSERASAEEALRQADRRKDEFLATLAHELRNPLAALVSQMDLLRMIGADAAARARSVAVMDRQTRQLTRLVNDLLDISRITQGQLSLQLQPQSVNRLLALAGEACSDTVAAAGQRLQLNALPDDVCVLGDEARLVQVFSNLLHNAVKFSPRDGEVTLRAHAADGWVHVAVQDQGIGFAPEMTESIFEMFTQATPSPGRRHDGLGIGLPLSRRLVQLHGGRLLAASAGAGQGSCFTVSLPTQSAAQRAAAALLAPADHGAGAPGGQGLQGLQRLQRLQGLSGGQGGQPSQGGRGGQGGEEGQGRQRAPDTQDAQDPPAHSNPADLTAPLRILVVDDNHDAAASLTELLRLVGHDATMVLDGHAAVRACAEQPPDVLVIDIGMPGLDGYQTAEAIRALPCTPRPLLIALSGWGQPADRDRSLHAGFDLHLVKPVDVDALRRALAQATARPRTPPS